MLTDKRRQQAAQRQQRFRQRQQEARRVEQASKGLPALPKIANLPGYARWRAALSSARTLVEQIQQEMADYYEQRSEAWQEGEAGTHFVERQEAVEALLSQWEEVTL
jgi:hypothetical protein